MAAERIALVTGARGFLGRHVAAQLAQEGWHVMGLGHGAWTQTQARAWGLSHWIEGDVDSAAFALLPQTPALIVHCAGSSGVAASLADPQEDFRRSAASTASVLDYMRRRAPGAVLVLTSSAAVYGDAQRLPIVTQAPLRPQSPYGVHKLMAEQLCLSHARHFGLRAAIVRLFSLYGVGLRKQLIWDAGHRLLRGDVNFAGTGEERRDFLHVGDAARLLVLAGAHAGAMVPIVNGATGVGTPVRTIVEMLASHLRVAAPLRFNGESRSGDPLHLVGDTSGARAFGWSPARDLRVELAACAHWIAQGAPGD